MSRRTEFRSRIGELLLASEGPYAGAAYCASLATFATEADVKLLDSYLERYLRRSDLFYDQAFALGALLPLDRALGSEHPARFLAPDGLWQQWLAGPPVKSPDLPAYCHLVDSMCAFARSAAVAGTGKSK